MRDFCRIHRTSKAFHVSSLWLDGFFLQATGLHFQLVEIVLHEEQVPRLRGAWRALPWHVSRSCDSRSRWRPYEIRTFSGRSFAVLRTNCKRYALPSEIDSQCHYTFCPAQASKQTSEIRTFHTQGPATELLLIKRPRTIHIQDIEDGVGVSTCSTASAAGCGLILASIITGKLD